MPVKRWQNHKKRESTKKEKKTCRKANEGSKKRIEAEQVVSATLNSPPSSYSRMPNAIELLDDDVGTFDSFSCLVNSDQEESEDSSLSDQDSTTSNPSSSEVLNVWPPMVRKKTPTVLDAASDNSEPDDEHFSSLLHRREGGQMLHNFSDSSKGDGDSSFGSSKNFSKPKTSGFGKRRSCNNALPVPVVPKRKDVWVSAPSSPHGQSQCAVEASDIKQRRRGNDAANSFNGHVLSYTSTIGNRGIDGMQQGNHSIQQGRSQYVTKAIDIEQRRRGNIAPTTTNVHGKLGMHGIDALFGHFSEKVGDQNNLFSSEVNDCRIKIILEALKKAEDARRRIDNELARAKRRVASLRAKLTENLSS